MFFDSKAHSYDDWYETPIGRFADEVETALAFSLFPVHKDDLVLDAGCGTGNFSLKLARRGAQVTGIDIAPGMLSRAQEKAAREGQPVSFLEMDIYNLSFPSNYFDGVISMAAFEFIHEPLRAYRELKRVLKPGGHLLIGTINKESAWGALYEERAQRPDSIFRHARFMNMEELLNLDREHVMGSGECLFLPPGTPEENINLQEEKRLAVPGRGGFIACLWQKPR